MASVYICTTPGTDIDYSVVDGRVRSFTLRGELLYDEDAGVSTHDWEKQLVKLVEDQQLAVDDGRGLHAFVYRLIIEGRLTTTSLQA